MKNFTVDFILNQVGDSISFKAAVELMDDDCREAVHGRLAPCSNQAFFDAYCLEHKERFGENFVLQTSPLL